MYSVKTSIDYAELVCTSNFTFLNGASHPQELVAHAAELGYYAIALTDECSLAGIVRAFEEARRCKKTDWISSSYPAACSNWKMVHDWCYWPRTTPLMRSCAH